MTAADDLADIIALLDGDLGAEQESEPGPAVEATEPERQTSQGAIRSFWDPKA